MTWVKLDDHFTEHPKIKPLSHGAFRLQVEGLCWSARWLTDGFLPADQVPLMVHPYKASFVAELTSKGAWEEAEGGWQIHDYLKFQMSAAKVRADREGAAKRMRTGRERKERSSDVRPNIERTSSEVQPLPVPVPVTPNPLPKSHGSHQGVAAEEGWGRHEAKGPNETPETRDRRRGLALRWQSVLGERGVKAGHRECNEVVAKSLHLVDWKVVDEQIGWFLESTVAPYSPKVLESAVARVAYR